MRIFLAIILLSQFVLAGTSKRIIPFMNKTKPPVVASYSTYSRNTLATTDSIPLPSGVAAGDLMIIYVVRVLAGGYFCTGWTEFINTPDSARVRSFYKIATGAETTATCTSGNNQRLSAAVALRITGADTIKPIDAYSWSSLVGPTTLTASVTAGVMTVTAKSGVNIAVGDLLSGSTTPTGVTVTSFGTGSGGTGTYNISNSGFSQASSTMYTINPNAVGISLSPTHSNDLVMTGNMLVGSGLNGSNNYVPTVASGETKVVDYYSTGQTSTISPAWVNLLNVSASGTKTMVLNDGAYESMVINALISPPTTAKIYAQWNSIDKGTSLTLSNGNLTVGRATTGNNASVRANVAKNTGKWYWEVKQGTISGCVGVGNQNAPLGNASNSWLGIDANGLGYCENGVVYKNSSIVNNTGKTFTTNDVIGIALDADNGTVSFYKNNVLAYTASGGNVPAKVLFPMWSTDNAQACNTTANFGATTQAYAAPSGYNTGIY